MAAKRSAKKTPQAPSPAPRHAELPIQTVRIILVRHGQANSNVAVDEPGLQGQHMTRADLEALSSALIHGDAAYVSRGEFLPDGLTQHGIDSTRALAKGIVDADRRLRNVYFVASSPLTRAVQTQRLLMPAFELVGPWHRRPDADDARTDATDADGTRPDGMQAGTTPPGTTDTAIYCHPGLGELSSWPHDLPSLPKEHGGRRVASYMKLRGGPPCCRPGTVLGVHEVDLGGVVNPWEMLTHHGRLADALTPRTLPGMAASVRDARRWLRGLARQAADAHGEHGGTPHVVVCAHGGVMNLLTGVYNCKMERDGEAWRWIGSNRLRNLDVTAWTFAADDDEGAALVQAPFDQQYRDVFGEHYTRVEVERDVADGRAPPMHVQVQAHMKFLEDIDLSVRTLHATRPDYLDALLRWQGPEAMLGVANWQALPKAVWVDEETSERGPSGGE